MVLLFIGPSGSGKDTQADILKEKFQFERVSTGDLARDISDGNHPVEKAIRNAMNEGFLADDFIFSLLQIYLAHSKVQNLILSGAVRRFSQIELLDIALFKVNRKLDKVVYFELSDEEAVRRMTSRLTCPKDGSNYNLIYNRPEKEGLCDLCGTALIRREDDNEESIRKRLQDFHKDNHEILDEYKKRNILIQLDASRGIEEVNGELVDKLGL